MTEAVRNPDGSITVPFTMGEDDDGTMFDGGPETYQQGSALWVVWDRWLTDVEAASI